MDNLLELLKKIPPLFIGLFLFALGLVANLYSRLVMNPWAVLTVGIVNQTPRSLAFRIGRYDRRAEHIDIFRLFSSLSGKGSLS